MYRGIAHPGLSRIPTSRHVSIGVNRSCGYGYRQLSSSTALWKAGTPMWGFRGTKGSRERAMEKKIVWEKAKREQQAGIRKTTDPAWNSIPPPASVKPVEFRVRPPTDGTALTGSETSFIWGKGKNRGSGPEKIDPMLPASAVLGRVRPGDNKRARRAASERADEAPQNPPARKNETPTIRWTGAPQNGYANTWPSGSEEATWTEPKIRKHLSNVPPGLNTTIAAQTLPPPIINGPPRISSWSANLRDHEREDYEWRINKKPAHTYTPLEPELEPWDGERSELPEVEEGNEIISPEREISRDGRGTYRGSARYRPQQSYNDRNDDLEEMTILKRPARVLPFTTGTSEFLYGYNICRLAMKEKRRKIYKLYVYTGMMRQGGTLEKESILRRIAEDSKVEVESTMDLGLLDAMSKGRPHNGFVLEAEALQIPKVGHLVEPTSFGTFNAPIFQSSQYVQVKLKQQGRQPFVLILDELLDGGNFGAILRSAYFLGVDAVFIVSKNSTPATAVTSRSSAGALECIDYYNVGDLPTFITESKSRGWKFYGAMPSPTQRELKSSKTKTARWYDMEGLGDPTSRGPVALVLGNEADGLRPSIQKMMDAFVTIRKGDTVDDVVDSLNVGVAASILTHAFLHPAVRGAPSLPAVDRRTTKRRIEGKLPQENMLFQVDDGKYTAPRYEGGKAMAAGAAASAGGMGAVDLLDALKDQKVEEEDPLKGWNPDDDVDGSLEEVAENEVTDGKEERGLVEEEEDDDEEMWVEEEEEGEEEEEEGWGEEEEELESLPEEWEDESGESFEIDEEIPKQVEENLASKRENSKGRERKIVAEGAQKRVPESSSTDKKPQTNVEATGNEEQPHDEFEFVDVPEPAELSPQELTYKIAQTNPEARINKGEPDDGPELEWEDVVDLAEKNFEQAAEDQDAMELKQEYRKKRYEWDAIKPVEPDFSAGLVGPSLVIGDPVSLQKARELEKKKNSIQPLKKGLQEIADAKGFDFNNKNPTKKQKKLLKKEQKKLNQNLRKKVREEAASVRSALAGGKDPVVLKGVAKQQMTVQIQHEKKKELLEEIRREGGRGPVRRKGDEEKTLPGNENANEKGKKIKQKGKDETDYVKAGTWNVSEALQ
ncbi:hypothetical protein TWF481_010556 [Arthrobotrys musiformis]|uniref:rRNA methyltransferase 1, mitochondrial n=1 Tax=Arthrobotrys musiformis TaxID=47236 RepID=A0AAV9W195_9PEZI